MKHLYLTIVLLFGISPVFAQMITFTEPVPKYGCPNTTHSVSLGVTNNTPLSAPANSLTITTTIETSSNVQFYTNTQTNTTAVAAYGTYIITLPNIDFPAAMVCNVYYSVAYTVPTSGTYNSSTTYTVQSPPDITTIAENPAGTLEVTSTMPEAVYSIAYYKDGNYTSTANVNATGVFTPSSSGSYTAKAYETNSGCASVNPSNAVNITVSTTDVKEGQNVNVSVYPNPMASSVTISTALTNALTYEIADMNGVVVKTAEFTAVTNVNVENLKSGSYMLIVKDKNEKVASYKLVK